MWYAAGFLKEDREVMFATWLESMELAEEAAWQKRGATRARVRLWKSSRKR